LTDTTAGRLWIRHPQRHWSRLWLLYPHSVSTGAEKKDQSSHQLASPLRWNFRRDLILRLTCLFVFRRNLWRRARWHDLRWLMVLASGAAGLRAVRLPRSRLWDDSCLTVVASNPLRMKRPQPRALGPRSTAGRTSRLQSFRYLSHREPQQTSVTVDTAQHNHRTYLTSRNVLTVAAHVRSSRGAPNQSPRSQSVAHLPASRDERTRASP